MTVARSVATIAPSMHAQDIAIVKSLVSVAWADGKFAEKESEMIDALLEAFAASPEQAASYRGGKKAALGWFVGQVMKKTGGKANPKRVNELLQEALDKAD